MFALKCYKNKVPYVYGSGRSNYSNPASVDCSSLVYCSYYNAQLSPMPSSYTRAMINEVIEKDTSQLLPGDVVVFVYPNGGHTMIYLATNSEGPVWVHAKGTNYGIVLKPQGYDYIRQKHNGQTTKFGTFKAMEGL